MLKFAGCAFADEEPLFQGELARALSSSDESILERVLHRRGGALAIFGYGEVAKEIRRFLIDVHLDGLASHLDDYQKLKERIDACTAEIVGPLPLRSSDERP